VLTSVVGCLFCFFCCVVGFRGRCFGWWFSWPDLPFLLELVGRVDPSWWKWEMVVDSGFDSVFVDCVLFCDGLLFWLGSSVCSLIAFWRVIFVAN